MAPVNDFNSGAMENFLPAQGGRQERFNFFDLNLATARADPGTEIVLSGYAFIWVCPVPFTALSGGGYSETTIDAAGTVGKAMARFGMAGDPAVPLLAGNVYVLPANKTIYIVNSAQTAAMMRVYYSTGPRVIPYAQEVRLVGAAASSVPTTADVALGAAATTLVIAANSNRKKLWVTNLAAGASTIRIGDASAGAARGIPLTPGQTAIIDTTAAVYAYSVTAQSVAVMEEVA